MWCGVLGMWRTVFQEIHNEPEHRKISLSTVSLLPWEGNPSCRSGCVCVCVPQWNSQRFRISHSLSHTCTDTQTHTLPKVFCLFVLGVTLKPWCLATRPCSFKWQADIPIPSGCLTISPTYFSLSYCLPLFFTLVHTLPTPHTHIYKHTQRTLTDENWLLWSWRSTAAAKLITLRHRSQCTQLFQWCGQTPISITTAATFFLLICHAKEKNKKKKNALPSIPRAEV